MDKNTPAFPRAGFSSPIHVADVGEPGMTLLDYFAAKAMQSFNIPPAATWEQLNTVATNSYRLASAILEERKKYINNGQ